ncbi:MAG: hypothetical protein KBT88_11705 [Gammaproteobacteria bacterium]|nr:hypothetical protein [Gammaproteobacteria bacterium]MBQ0840441.1 hypothetical protein [Gammaproteobacteria bacterium]
MLILGGVYNEFAIGDIFTTKYSFETSALADCSGTVLITCTFLTGSFVEFSGDPNNSGVLDYSLLNSSFQPDFLQDNSPYLDDYFNWNSVKVSTTGFLSNYLYSNVISYLGGGGFDFSNIHTGENSLGSIFNQVNLDPSFWWRGVGLGFYNDRNGEIGIIGTRAAGVVRFNTINKVPEPSSLPLMESVYICFLAKLNL